MNPVELRHLLHETPELGLKEYKTTEILIEHISPIPNVKIHRPLETGLLAEYRVNEGPFFLFRADIDGLNIKEENDIPFKSKSNFMHACGHDVHMSVLYGFLQWVVEKKVEKNIIFLFQPAEELILGAQKIFDSGILDSFNISSAFALHVTDEYPEGTIASTPGVLFASAFELDVEFYGVNSHVAFPHNGKNAFNAMRMFFDTVDKIPKDPAVPFVFAAGKITAGEVRNIVPAFAKFEATMRSLSSHKSEIFYKKLEEVLDGIKIITGVDYAIKKGAFSKEVVCNKGLYEEAFKKLSPHYNFIDCGYKMTAEDFGFISQRYPSFMFWLGTGLGETCGLHNSRFLPGDEAVLIGIDILSKIIS